MFILVIYDDVLKTIHTVKEGENYFSFRFSNGLNFIRIIPILDTVEIFLPPYLGEEIQPQSFDDDKLSIQEREKSIQNYIENEVIKFAYDVVRYELPQIDDESENILKQRGFSIKLIIDKNAEIANINKQIIKITTQLKHISTVLDSMI